jgi:hypothetical protein
LNGGCRSGHSPRNVTATRAIRRPI